MSIAEGLRIYWSEVAQMVESMPLRDVLRAAEMILECHERSGRIFVLGNGGSAATASHFATDLGKGTRVPGTKPFRVIALTENIPLVTALANDNGYERVFADQLSALAEERDLIVFISASGNSTNVIAAADVAQEANATLLALTGETGGRMRHLADHCVMVPARRIEQVEDAHMVIAHSICVAIRERLRSQSRAKQPHDRDRAPAGSAIREAVSGLGLTREARKT